MKGTKESSRLSDKDEKHIGPYVRHLSKSIREAVDTELDTVCNQSGMTRLTAMQAHVMGYLFYETEKGNVIYQKDIEQVFHIQRSTATGILKLLEQSGSIRRECDSSDARMKRITVTEEALQHKKKIDSAIDRIENKLLTGLTEEEIKTYIDLTEKMRRNLES